MRSTRIEEVAKAVEEIRLCLGESVRESISMLERSEIACMKLRFEIQKELSTRTTREQKKIVKLSVYA